MGGDDDEAEEGEDEDAGDIDDAPTLVEYEVDVYFLCFFLRPHTCSSGSKTSRGSEVAAGL